MALHFSGDFVRMRYGNRQSFQFPQRDGGFKICIFMQHTKAEFAEVAINALHAEPPAGTHGKKSRPAQRECPFIVKNPDVIYQDFILQDELLFTVSNILSSAGNVPIWF